MDELDEALADYLTNLAAAILRCDRGAVLWDADIDEYGFQSLHVNQLCLDLNEKFGVDVNPAVFLEVTSLEALCRYLRKHYFRNIEASLL